MSFSSLDKLKGHRDELLLAEIAALLHDMGKCADDQIIHQASDCPSGHTYRYKTAQSWRLPSPEPHVSFLGEISGLRDLIEHGMPRAINDATKPWLLRALGRCHSVAHIDKELEDRHASTKQPSASTRLSSAFGIEGNPVSNVQSGLDKLNFRSLQPASWEARQQLVEAVEEAFQPALGDTRRPVNEVTLWDWSYAVASLYKAALAGAALGIKPEPDNLKWRLLRINLDVLALYSKAIRIADLLGYRQRMEDACEAVKKLVEYEYSLGNEVYRDTTGIYFTFPDVNLPSDLEVDIPRIVEEVEPELAPRIHADPTQGKDVSEQLGRLLADQHLQARRELVVPQDHENVSTCWNALWANLPHGAWEVCPVCRLRPKKEDQEACEHCQKRRESRIEQWLRDPKTTIWLDEIADHNDRIAVVVAKFGLDDWQSGDLVETLLVKAMENNPCACVSKNPSPSRLRRIWETCQQFWTDTVTTELTSRIYGVSTPTAALRLARLAVTPKEQFKCKTNIPYDGTFRGNPISLLWLGQTFVTISNLQLAAGDAKQLDELIEGLEESGIDLEDPADSRRRIPLAVKGAQKVTAPLGTYSPSLTLLESPDQFIALVPAAEALDVAAKIRDAYAREFGKVQDRLPIFLGLVFFHRKTPLFAAIDTARRMLSQVELVDEQWEVECSCPSPDGQHHRLRLSQGSSRIAYDIPVKMGDKQTEDLWYPYLFVESQTDNRSQRFQVKEGKYAHRWLMHASGLRPKDKLRVWPSRFGYKFLEHSARRFEFDRRRDIMYLDELPRLREMWNGIRKTTEMTDTRLRGAASLLEAKKDDWGSDSEEFRRLAETTLKQAKLLGEKPAVTPEDVICGRFSRCLELHLRILKQRVKEQGDGERKQPEPVSV
jgi:hypothetical protein